MTESRGMDAHVRNEDGRLEALRRYRLLDTPPEQPLDDLAALAAQICATPIALISLVDADRQWFKANVGMPFVQTARAISFCSHAIAGSDVCVVPDTALDPRFRDNPIVTGDDHIRFYAGAPLISPDGHALGTLCVLDRVPRTLTGEQQDALRKLSRQVMAQLELLRQRRELGESETRLRIVTENARVGLAIVGSDRAYVYANRTYIELLGLPFDDLVGRRVAEVLQPAHEDLVRPLLDRALAGERVGYETELPGRQPRAIAMQYEPTRDDAGAPIVVGVATDVTERRQAEVAMRVNHERFQTVARATNDAVWDWDLRTDDLWWNEGFRTGFGYAGDDGEPTVASREERIHPDDVERVTRGLHAAIEHGQQVWSDEYRFRRRDGTYADVVDRGHVIRDASGRALRMVGAMQDVSDRKRAEAAERAARDLLTDVINSTPSAIFATDRGHRYVMVNDAYAKFLGQAPEAIVGRTHHDFFPADVVANFLALNDAVMRTGEGCQLEERVNGVLQMTTKFPIRDAQGDITGLVAVATDVSELHRASEALRESEERVRFALQAADAGIWDLDVASGRLQWSEILEKQYGLAPGSFAGTIDAYVARIHPDDQASARAGVERVMKAGGDFTFEHRSVWPDGSVRWLNGIGRIELNDDGQPVRGVGISLDVTSRRTLEAQFQQAQKMEAVGRLAGGVAHDFNNLLTAILGYCELLQEDFPEGDDRRASLVQIQKAGASAATLTRQLLAFSRQQLIEPAQLDLNAVVSAMRAMLDRLIGEDVAITVSLEPHLPPVLADRGQLEQVVMNLAVNARDAMPLGGTLRIGTAAVVVAEQTHVPVAPGPYVVLTITDTGAGMTAAVQERLFEPFFTTKPVGKGTGLGLATVHGIVTRCGGCVTVDSEVGMGTAFAVYLPVAAPDATETPSALQPRHGGGSETILVVEDAHALRELTRRLLERQGYRVLVAANADEAVAVFEQDAAIDLLLTDVVMPGASGPELTRTLVARRPTLKVLFMSGYTDDAIAQHDVSARGTAFLAKPFTSETLSRKIRQVLDQ